MAELCGVIWAQQRRRVPCVNLGAYGAGGAGASDALISQCQTCKIPPRFGFYYDAAKVRWRKREIETEAQAADRFCREAMGDGGEEQCQS